MHFEVGICQVKLPALSAIFLHILQQEAAQDRENNVGQHLANFYILIFKIFSFLALQALGFLKFVFTANLCYFVNCSMLDSFNTNKGVFLEEISSIKIYPHHIPHGFKVLW